MKFKIFFFLILCTSLANAMQPAQLLSNVASKVATEKLIDLISTMYFLRESHSREQARQLYTDIETLLKQGANPNVFNISKTVQQSNPPQIGVTPALNASIAYPAIMELLLKAGAKPTGISIFVGGEEAPFSRPLQKLEDLDPVLIERINNIPLDYYYLTSNDPLTDAINMHTPHRTDLVRMLLKAGSIPEYENLYEALQKEDAGILSILLNHLPWPPPEITTLNKNDQYYVRQILCITNHLKYSPYSRKNEIFKIFEIFENPLLSAVDQADVTRVRQLIATGQENPFERKHGPAPNLSLQSPYQLAFEKYGDPQNRHLKSKYKQIIELLESDTKHKKDYLKKIKESAARGKNEI